MLARGHLHLSTRARVELEDVFVGMGFTVAEGPEAETDWYNFEALNIPPGHPARGMYDTMYLDVGEPETVLLRTHTSPVQIHLMEAAVRDNALPIHAVMPGKCFRLDTPDARHLPVFNQIEGLVVDRGITFGDLAGPSRPSRRPTSARACAPACARPTSPSPSRPPSTRSPAPFASGGMPHLLPHRLDRAGGLRHGRSRRLRRRGDRRRRLVGFRLRVRHRSAGADAPCHTGHALLPGERHPLPLAVLTSPHNEKVLRARSSQLAP